MKKNDLFELDVVSLRLTKDRSLYSEEPVTSPQVAVESFGEFLKDMPQEYFCSINLDGAGCPINASICSIGTANSTIANPGETLKTALLSNASSVIVLHNHPSGNIMPSRQDIALTKKMMDACNLVGITLDDHIIVGSNGVYRSMREEQDLSGWQKQVSIVAESPSEKESINKENLDSPENNLSWNISEPKLELNQLGDINEVMEDLEI
jgi:DNA repair protein RadC